MSNRNFDSRVVIQRLRDKNMAQNFAQFQQNGQSIINNPQTSDPSPQRIGQYYDGAGTAVVQNLLGGGYTVNLGATANFTPSTPPVQPTLSPPTITTVIGNHKSLVVEFTQTPVSGITITNYEYSTDGGITYMAFAPPTTSSPLIITAESSDGTTELVNGTTYSVVLKALTATQVSAPSNIVTGTPTSIGLSTFTDVETTSWTAPADIYRVEYLLVGGGGGGGGSYDTGAGAGGGGGLVLTGMYTVTPGNIYSIVVGDGGAGGTGATGTGDTNGISGENTLFDTILAVGGGSGGRSLNDRTGVGGAIGNASTLTAPTGGKGGRDPQNSQGGGGGGGMGSAGSTATSGGGAGGTGISYSISGSSVTYASGGTGGTRNTNVNGSAGTANTGNGGGGSGALSGDGSIGGKGGSGIVIIKY